MFFNFFIFSVAISGFYKLIELGFTDFGFAQHSVALLDPSKWPMWSQLVVFFVVLDFVQWVTHIMLHKIPLFWKFHKVHHSVTEMGFAAHLRYHWMENILYKPLKTFSVMILFGFEPEQAYIVHFLAIAIGHFNHSNIKITWGPLRYLLNNPVMHLYHHAYNLPEGKFGVNFGISLSLWDYLFKTNYIPEDSGMVKLGFPGVEKFPNDFLGQNSYGLRKRHN
jgi:sterol desaturase/sphingolipid hydroxylase (fatty acid hydroxylase superfamily)